MNSRNDLLPDVQAYLDRRNLPIQRAGIRGLRYPLSWQLRTGVQHSVAEFVLDVSVPASQRGTHMSRFVGLLEEHCAAFDLEGLEALHQRMLERLNASDGRLEARFPIFLRKRAPVSGLESFLDYQVAVQCEGSKQRRRVELAITAPVTSLCPCSREVADYGAHNQRSHLTLKLRIHPARLGNFDPERLVAIAEAQASSEVYGLLKRIDEKLLTERAYDNPKFVEDLVRDLAAALDAIHPGEGVLGYCVQAENFESIHNHSAWAELYSATWRDPIA
jgi:GTP cyclohydrolase I